MGIDRIPGDTIGTIVTQMTPRFVYVCPPTGGPDSPPSHRKVLIWERSFHVVNATLLCCNNNMQTNTTQILDAIFQRRAVKVFETVEISEIQRELILEAVRFAPSSFNM